MTIKTATAIKTTSTPATGKPTVRRYDVLSPVGGAGFAFVGGWALCRLPALATGPIPMPWLIVRVCASGVVGEAADP